MGIISGALKVVAVAVVAVPVVIVCGVKMEQAENKEQAAAQGITVAEYKAQLDAAHQAKVKAREAATAVLTAKCTNGDGATCLKLNTAIERSCLVQVRATMRATALGEWDNINTQHWNSVNVNSSHNVVLKGNNIKAQNKFGGYVQVNYTCIAPMDTTSYNDVVVNIQ